LNSKFFLHHCKTFFFVLSEIGHTFADSFHEADGLVVFLAEKGSCRIDGILQIVNIQIDRVGEDSVATILGHKESRNSENCAIHCPFFQASEHGWRGAKLNGLDVFYSHAPFS
jgi:hypothetical protein